ncbi:Cinnamoyl-CoA reductase 1 [Platanthera zijinensis]|uniref:Cinnamoyl-CoA reductase 1 n=1 Tax=Platanthera zijinensis TaxID=2320716 RepID=A0AAP0FZ44_9ASPA
MEGKKICVTGAGGYIASWLVKLLLSKGYKINGTVRDPDNEKNDHLKKFDMASENLQLFKADVLNYGELFEAIQGCEGVFHVASPVPGFKLVPNPEALLSAEHQNGAILLILHNHQCQKGSLGDPVEVSPCDLEVTALSHGSSSLLQKCKTDMITPALTGTLNVLKACSEVGIKRVLLVSSSVTILRNSSWPKDRVMDESCWSEEHLLRETKHWYGLSKTLAERAAWEYSKKTGLNLVTVCPSMVYGPLLQSTVNATSLMLLDIIKGTSEPMVDKLWHFVDVRDVADALLLVYETAEASGRYICAAHPSYLHEIITKLKSIYPNYKYQQNFTEFGPEYRLSSEKLKTLGWKARPLEETLVDSVEFFRQAGLLEEVAA